MQRQLELASELPVHRLMRCPSPTVAAAGSLRDQATHLLEAVKVFRLQAAAA